MCRVVYHDDDTFLERKLNDDLKCQMNQSETVSQIKVYLYAELSVLPKILDPDKLVRHSGFDQMGARRQQNFINYSTCNF
mmetsp:Transcript_13432/g.23864  ORF Transcript_13432/g.23864 Transcript_13432/m.23864 type:complete len:80 (-) Transcript_13432:867-1106(-)